MKTRIAWLFVFVVIGVGGMGTESASARTLETRCTHQDCFRHGWTTTEPGTDYVLECQCIENDCENRGWKSIDNRSSRFSVKCKSGGCFNAGWTSIENRRGWIWVDFVSCRNENCLSDGWTIRSTYSWKQGEVSCKDADCRHQGGISQWRGQRSETTCDRGDCYRYGWSAEIEDRKD